MTEVAVAILQQGEKVLIGQRPNKGDCALDWEFPGGKCEQGETPQQCVVRECQEELGVEIGGLSLYHVLEHTYPSQTVRVYFWQAHILQGKVQRRVHQQLLWVPLAQLGQYSFCKANAPVIQKLLAQAQNAKGL